MRFRFPERTEVVPWAFRSSSFYRRRAFNFLQEETNMKKKKSLNITLAIFIGLVLGILFGLFMPGRYEFALPVV